MWCVQNSAYYASVENRWVDEHRRLSSIAFGVPQHQGRAVARLGKLKLTSRQKVRRFYGISFSLSKRAELALALRAMMHSLARCLWADSVPVVFRHTVVASR